ncbi:Transthyretin-like family protein [Aphelenchoides fujianensis]|nr:Transthyretin-like family protein [Aphelenchoides fujianensis]
MKSLLFVAVLLVGCAQAIAGIGRSQSVAVRGNLRCKNEAASGVTVSLVDHNFLLSDDTLAFADTDQNGNFYLSGHRSEISDVDPELKIKHSCDHYFEHCVKLRIPGEFVSAGKTPNRVYEVGTVHLEAGADSC